MKNLLLVLGAIALLMAVGCSTAYEGDHMSESRKKVCGAMLVAVMPFQGVAESPGSGLIVADIMANELYALGGYVLVTPEVVAARTAPREGEALSPEEAGALVGAPYILTGRVTEYTYRLGVGEQPAVGVTARLVETATGRVLWSATRARTGGAWLREESLGVVASRVCHDLAQSINWNAREYGWGAASDEYETQLYPLDKADEKDAAEAVTDEDFHSA